MSGHLYKWLPNDASSRTCIAGNWCAEGSALVTRCGRRVGRNAQALNAEGFGGEGAASLSPHKLAQRRVREKARQRAVVLFSRQTSLPHTLLSVSRFDPLTFQNTV